jgi:hypothetical protein
MTHHACVNRDIQEPRKGASLAIASQLVRTIIITSFCQGSVFWMSLALISWSNQQQDSEF